MVLQVADYHRLSTQHMVRVKQSLTSYNNFIFFYKKQRMSKRQKPLPTSSHQRSKTSKSANNLPPRHNPSCMSCWNDLRPGLHLVFCFLLITYYTSRKPCHHYPVCWDFQHQKDQFALVEEFVLQNQSITVALKRFEVNEDARSYEFNSSS